MAIHMDHGLILKFKGRCFFGLIGYFEDIFLLVLGPDMIILIPFAGKLPEFAANTEYFLCDFSASAAEK